MRFFERLVWLDKMPVIAQERVTKKDPHCNGSRVWNDDDDA